jgi:HD-GYP domain-containing protein (c-di-GMP phosphodiesterase class II)
MVKTKTKGGLALTGAAMGVQERVGLCAALLQLRASASASDDPLDAIKKRALIERRAMGLRKQLLPNWVPPAGVAQGSASMVPEKLHAVLGEELAKLAQDAPPALQIEAGLKAADILQLSRLLEGEEIELGLRAEHQNTADLTGLIRTFTDLPEPADTPEYMRGHVHAKASMYRAIEEGSYSAQELESAKLAFQWVDFPSLETFDPMAYKEMEAHRERSNAVAGEFIALRDSPLEDTEQARQDRAQALQELLAKQRAIDAEYIRLSDALSERVYAAIDVQRQKVDQAELLMKSLTAKVVDSSEVTEKDAKSWAQAIEITPDAEAALRKGGYAPTQVRKDAAEFFRFVRGRLDTVRILTHERERAAANMPHGNPGQIFVPKSGKNFNKRVLWHELGHHIEADPSAAAAARLFIRMRSDAGQSDKLSKLTGDAGYEDDEIAFVDHFFSPYMGKIYAHGMTEIFSMVLESYSDPVLLAQRLTKDPQSFAFVRGFIERPRDALEKLHLSLRQESRHVVDAVAQAKAKAVKAYEQRHVASAGFKPDSTDYLYGSAYSRILATMKAKPLGTMPGSVPGQVALFYSAKVVKESAVQVKDAKGRVKTKTVRTKVDGHYVVVANGQPGAIELVTHTSHFVTDRLNWVLAYMMRWRAEGFSADKRPDPVKVSEDLQGMIL